MSTVVIGDLITATLLTLIVLPILYYYSDVKLGSRLSSNSSSTNHSNSSSKSITALLCIIFFLGMMFATVQAQDKTAINKIKTTVEQAIEVALKNHPQIKSKILQIQQQEPFNRKTSTFTPTPLYPMPNKLKKMPPKPINPAH